MPLINIENLSFAYQDGHQALRAINLRIEAGEFVLLCGPSGGGKSTLLRVLNGLIPHFFGGELTGRVMVAGANPAEVPVYEMISRVGLVFQDADAQLFASTVERELAFGLESLGLPPQQMRHRIAWAAEVTGIEGLLGRRPHSLSGGEKQLVAIAAALALKPRVLALDEPFAHLDPAASRRVSEVLREVNALGITVLVAEHRLHHLLPYATRMVVISRGRIALDGSPERVLRADVEGLGLNVPAPVRLFKSLGIENLPLPRSAEEAVALLRGEAARGLSFEAAKLRGLLGLPEHPRPPVEREPPAVACRGVRYAYDGREALRGATLLIPQGEIVAVVGPNGAGKTTLIKHFNGLLKPQRGKVEILGMDTRSRKVSELASRVGLVFQSPEAQLFAPSVREELLAGPNALGRSDPRWLEELMGLFGLGDLLDRPPLLLSEGERKRVAFASVLASRPEIVVLDEPTAGQDEPSRRRLGELLRELGARGHTVVLVTHDLEFAEENAGIWFVLAGGKILSHGSPGEVMSDEAVMSAASLFPTERFVLWRELVAAGAVKSENEG